MAEESTGVSLKSIVHTGFAAGCLCVSATAAAAGNGNPYPGFPHDTIVFHVKKWNSQPTQCDGGHALFIREVDGVIPETIVRISMIDWHQLDNDNDGNFDEDEADGIDNDGDGLVDEDGKEPGNRTAAVDCDSSNDGEVALLMRDTNPMPGVISTQKWNARLIGKPENNFAFTTSAEQVVTCAVVSDPDGVPDSGDEVVECDTETVELAAFNLADSGCVKRVKLGGKNSSKGGGKTPWCDITDGFNVDVDTTGDGEADLIDQFVFSISCLDDPETELDETQFCPLAGLLWDIDESNTTSKAKVQIMVGHTGSATVKTGKIKGNNGG